VFAYTVKGWACRWRATRATTRPALDGAGRHCSEPRWADPETEWIGSTPRHRRHRLQPTPRPLRREPRSRGCRSRSRPRPAVRTTSRCRRRAVRRVLVDLSRNDDVARTSSRPHPTYATSTNLAGFINRVGVYSPSSAVVERRPVLKWAEGPSGQQSSSHLGDEPFLLLGQLGLSWDSPGSSSARSARCTTRSCAVGLDALIYAVYSGLAVRRRMTRVRRHPRARGGAHQSTITARSGSSCQADRGRAAYATHSTGCSARYRTDRRRSGRDTTRCPRHRRRTTSDSRLVRSTRRRSRRLAGRIGDAVLRRQVRRGLPTRRRTSRTGGRRTQPRRRVHWSDRGGAARGRARRQPSSPTRDRRARPST
jgi:hypothetical protein